MSETTSKRAYRKIAAEHLSYARKRFSEFASTSAVRDELKAMGAEYPYNALFYYWKKANPLKLKPFRAEDYLKTDEERAMYAEELAKEGGE